MRDKDLSHGSDNCQSTLSRRVSDQNLEIPEEKIGFPEKGIEFLRESGMGRDGFQSKPLKIGTSGSQELTLSYLCDPSKLGFKGKEVITEDPNQEDRWVERDFLNLNEIRGNSSKREVEEEAERETREKKPKLETLNLSLALPDVSLSLTASNPADQIWNCGEGTNGSVHSRFKPIGDGVGLSHAIVFIGQQALKTIHSSPPNCLQGREWILNPGTREGKVLSI
ncbi:unnamed protein product, partial [Vitis vinifera]